MSQPRGLEVHEADHRLEERRVHPLPAPGAIARDQRREHPLREDRAGRGVRDRDADARRTGARRARDAHHAAEALRDLVDTRDGRRTGRPDRSPRCSRTRAEGSPPRACRDRCAAGASPRGESSRRARRRARRGAPAPRAPRRSRGRRSQNACCGGGSRRRSRRMQTRSLRWVGTPARRRHRSRQVGERKWARPAPPRDRPHECRRADRLPRVSQR